MRIADCGLRTAEFCREIESYLCRKNDGHLIRVTGPSFDLVSDWASRGVPLKVAFAGIDRCFERYYRKGPRRRPVKIDFCEADVLDVFDEWRRAVGITTASCESPSVPISPLPDSDAPSSRAPSLPAHLERAVMRLSEARAAGTLGEAFDAIIDKVAAELDVSRDRAAGLRGAAREAAIGRLATLDASLLALARTMLGPSETMSMAREAEASLAPFRAGMAPEAFVRAREAAVDALVRERFKLPIVAYQHG